MRALALSLVALAACINVEPAPRPVGQSGNDQLPSCRVGQILARGATSWVCADPAGASIDSSKTPVLTGCTAGQVIAWNGNAWACTNPAAAVDPSKTPVVGSCSAGQFVTRTESGWGCATPTDTHLDSRVATLESEVQAITSSSYVTKTAEQTNVQPGACVSLTHDLGTTNLGYAGWMSVPGTSDWIPAAPLDGQEVDLALGATRTSQNTDTQNSDDAWPNNGLTDDAQWSSNGNALSSWWQVDLGAVKFLGSVRVTTAEIDRSFTGGVTTGWKILASTTGTFGTTPIATGSCTDDTGSNYSISSPTSCRSPKVVTLPANTTARYLRFVTTQSSGTDATLAELEVYPPKNPFVRVSDNELELCNVTPVARDLKLRVWQ